MSKHSSMGAGAASNWVGMFFGIFLMVFITVVLVATVITFTLPEAFASTTRFKVDWFLTKGALDNADSRYDQSADNPEAVQTILSVLQSDVILDKVTDVLELDTKWQQKYNSPTRLNYLECRQLLKRLMEVHWIRNTSLFSVKVYSDDKAEAAQIANALAEVYQTYERTKHDDLLAGSVGGFNELRNRLKSELADKTGDPKLVDAKITETIARAGQLYAALNAGIPGGRVEIVERAYPGARPVRPNKPLNIVLGIIAAGLAGVVIATGVVVLGILYRKPRTAVPPPSLA